MSSAPNSATPVATPAAVQEPCPTPLEWRVVLDEFRRLRRTWSAQAPGGPPARGSTFGSGLPLYVLGPAAGDSDLFALLAWLLKEEYCCVFVEPPRIGWPVRPLPELRQQSDAVLHAADRLQHERFAVLAVGAGTGVALDLCLNAPERVSHLAVLRGSAHFNASWPEGGFYLYGSVLPGALGLVPGWRAVQRRNHRAWFPPFDASRFGFLLENLAATPISQASRRMLLWAGLDFRPHLNALTLPVLLIHTEGEGRAIHTGMNELAAGLPHAQVEALHSAGHYPYLTHPHRVAKLMRTFLENAAPRSPGAPQGTVT